MGQQPYRSQSQQRQLAKGGPRGVSLVAFMIPDPSEAPYGNATLTGANLAGADLTDAIITEEQLAQCATLKGALMPNGSKHP